MFELVWKRRFKSLSQMAKKDLKRSNQINFYKVLVVRPTSKCLHSPLAWRWASLFLFLAASHRLFDFCSLGVHFWIVSPGRRSVVRIKRRGWQSDSNPGYFLTFPHLANFFIFFYWSGRVCWIASSEKLQKLLDAAPSLFLRISAVVWEALCSKLALYFTTVGPAAAHSSDVNL